MEPELIQAFSNLSQQLKELKEDIKAIKDQNATDHDRLIQVKARQDEIIRDLDAIGEKVRLQGQQIWKIYIWAGSLGAGVGGGAGFLFG